MYEPHALTVVKISGQEFITTRAVSRELRRLRRLAALNQREASFRIRAAKVQRSTAKAQEAHLAAWLASDDAGGRDCCHGRQGQPHAPGCWMTGLRLALGQ